MADNAHGWMNMGDVVHRVDVHGGVDVCGGLMRSGAMAYGEFYSCNVGTLLTSYFTIK